MKGTLLKQENTWIVEHWVGFNIFEYPLHTESLEELTLIPDFENLRGKEFEFEIIDEFTRPELFKGVPIFEGIKYAKLKLK